MMYVCILKFGVYRGYIERKTPEFSIEIYRRSDSVSR